MLTFVDLFSGAGGLGLGFEMAGAKQLLAVEQDKWACDTHRQNFPNVKILEENIESISSEQITELCGNNPDIVIGGPPCQGFSHANIVNKDPKDPRNSLFEEFLRCVNILQPKICLIENVPALLNTKTEQGLKVIDLILSELKKIGYHGMYQILDAKQFGVPQTRQRLFIIGIMNHLYEKGDKIYPSPTHGAISDSNLFEPTFKPEVTLWEAISDLPQYTYDDYDSKISYTSAPQNRYQELMRDGANGTLTNSEPMRHTKRIIERFKQIPIGKSEQHVGDEFSPMKRGEPSLFSTKKYSQNARRQYPDRPCNSVVASSHSNFIHPFLHRNFTVRELLRIQSFPDTFELKGKRAVLSKKLSIKKGLLDDIYLDQRVQVGNAVPPLLSKAIALNLKNYLNMKRKENVA